MRRLISAAPAAGCLVLSTPTFAGDDGAGVFDKWLDRDSSECAPLFTIKTVSTVTDQVGRDMTIGLGARLCNSRSQRAMRQRRGLPRSVESLAAKVRI